MRGSARVVRVLEEVLPETRYALAKERLQMHMRADTSLEERKATQCEYNRMKAKHDQRLYGNSRAAVYAALEKAEGLTGAAKVGCITQAANVSVGTKLSGKVCRGCDDALNRHAVIGACGHYWCENCFKTITFCPCGNSEFKRGEILGKRRPLDRLPENRVVPFPIIRVNHGTGAPVSEVTLWVASTKPWGLKHTHFLASLSDKMVYGVHSPVGNYFPYALSNDIYVMRVDPDEYKLGNIVRIEDVEPTGFSLHLPVIVASEAVQSGFYNSLYTGPVSPTTHISELILQMKRQFATSLGMPLKTLAENTLMDYLCADFSDILWAPVDDLPELVDVECGSSVDSLPCFVSLQPGVAWAADLATTNVEIGKDAFKVTYDKARGVPTNRQLRKIAKNDLRRLTRTPVLAVPVQTDQKVRDERTNNNKYDQKLIPLESYRELQDKYKKIQRELGDTARNLRANALDDTMMNTGRSKYLRSVFLPDEGPASIPDGVTRPHYNKAETVTGNFVVSEHGAGIFVVYPEHPTDLVANHYVLGDAGRYVFDQSLLTAQDLKDSYDYGRRSSQLLTFKSSTLPSGVYALNGTFNAVRVEGSASQVPSLQQPDLYNSILTNSADPLEKVGNVLVGDGIAILSLNSGFGVPYTRLGDQPPSAIAAGRFTANPPQITDRSADLWYSYTTVYDTVNTPAEPFAVSDVTMNVDSTTGLNFQINILAGNMSVGEYACTVAVTPIDLFGNEMTEYDQYASMQTTEDANLNFTFSAFLDTTVTGQRPVGAVRVRVVLDGPNANAAPTVTVNVGISVPIGARPGVVWPIALVAYQGVAPGSVITVTGMTNFELLPNPVLRQNLPLNNDPYDDNDRRYAQYVLSRRRQFGIRSVWALKDYMNARALLAEIADCRVNTRAEAFDWGKILGSVKQNFLPALKGAALGVLKDFATPYIGAAASGDVIKARAASGDIIMPKPFGNSMQTRFPRAYAAEGEVAWAADVIPRTRNQKPKPIVARDDRFVAFPVVVTTDAEAGERVVVRNQLYLASNVEVARFKVGVRTPSRQYFVQGQETVPQGFNINRNIYVCPIDASKFPKIVPTDGPIVRGASSDGAIWMVCNGHFKGVLPYAITGAVQPGGVLRENDFFGRKHEFCARHNIPLGANNPAAEVIIEDLAAAPVVAPRSRIGAE